MARIIGVEVPPNKRIDIALRYIYGIGPSNAKVILTNAKIDPSVRAKDLTEQQLSQIVHRQAVVMGYGDAFFMLTIFYFGLCLLVLLLKKPAMAFLELVRERGEEAKKTELAVR